ncbi:MAG: ferritin-like domain-containing protein [Alphaproteobacteria bacterium]
MKVGSEEHKKLMCRMLLDTFNPYKPSIIDWPKLDPDALTRLTGLPIWDIAVQTENRAMNNVRVYGERLIKDPLLKQAIALDAFEEGRHRHVLANLVEAYGIKLAPEPPYINPRDPEWNFLITGYSECIDSFLAFALFETAKRSGFFPPELVDTFEPVIQEEGRHILFFKNWVEWHKHNMPIWRRPWFALKVAAVWAYLWYERIGFAKDVGNGVQDNNFTMTGASQVGEDLSLGDLLALALSENDRRLAGYDPRLLKPEFVPTLARIALWLMGKSKAKKAGAVA